MPLDAIALVPKSSIYCPGCCMILQDAYEIARAARRRRDAVKVGACYAARYFFREGILPCGLIKKVLAYLK